MNKDKILSLIDSEIEESCRPWVLACIEAHEGGYEGFSRAAAVGCLRHLAVKAHGAFDIHIKTDFMEGATTRWKAVDRQGCLLSHGTITVPPDGDVQAYGLVAALADAVLRRNS